MNRRPASRRVTVLFAVASVAGLVAACTAPSGASPVPASPDAMMEHSPSPDAMMEHSPSPS